MTFERHNRVSNSGRKQAILKFIGLGLWSASVAVPAILVGCSPPSLMTNGQPAGPTIYEILDHINCELAQAMYDNPYEAKFLEKYHFIGSAELNLLVTNNQSFSPSLNFISPGAVAMTNFTLSVGGQLSGNQSQTYDFTYTIDFNTISRINPGGCKKYGPTYITDELTRPKSHSIGGELGLADFLKNGIGSINAVKEYDIYASSKPTPSDVEQAANRVTNSTEQLANAPTPTRDQIARVNGALSEFSHHLNQNEMSLILPHVSDVMNSLAKIQNISPEQKNITDPETRQALVTTQALAGKVGARVGNVVNKSAAQGKKTGGKGNDNQSPSEVTASTSFSSEFDFTIMAGVNGGPNWTLTHFKGPSGGGGGGAGGGAGTSGVGGMGMGGGNQGLFNFSRTSTDSLSIKLSAVCRDMNVVLPPNVYDYWAVVDPCPEGGPTVQQAKAKAALNLNQLQLERLNNAFRQLQ